MAYVCSCSQYLMAQAAPLGPEPWPRQALEPRGGLSSAGRQAVSLGPERSPAHRLRRQLACAEQLLTAASLERRVRHIRIETDQAHGVKQASHRVEHDAPGVQHRHGPQRFGPGVAAV